MDFIRKNMCFILVVPFYIAGLSACSKSSNRAMDEVLIINNEPGDAGVIAEIESEFDSIEIRKFNTSNVVWSVDTKVADKLIEKLQSGIEQGAGTEYFKLKSHYTDLFSKADISTDLSTKQSRILSGIKKNTSNIELLELAPEPIVTYAMDAGFDKLDGFTNDDSIRLPLTNDLTVSAVNSFRGAGEDGRVWSGKVVELIESNGLKKNASGDVLILSSKDSFAGTITVNSKIFSIRSLGEGLHAIYEKNIHALPEDHPPENESPVLLDSDKLNLFDNNTNDTPPGPHTVNIVVAYTKQVGDQYNSIVHDLIKVAELETNQSFSNSGISNLNIKVVHSYLTDYNETGIEWEQHLTRFSTGNDGFMDEIHKQRNTHEADIAVLIMNDEKYCGEAMKIGAAEKEAFAVVYHDCATGYYSFSHELAHLFGARHDLGVDKKSIPFKYGHGYLNKSIGSTKWRTIMGYARHCGGCIRIKHWSSPDVAVEGYASGTNEHEDNARVLTERAFVVSRFR